MVRNIWYNISKYRLRFLKYFGLKKIIPVLLSFLSLFLPSLLCFFPANRKSCRSPSLLPGPFHLLLSPFSPARYLLACSLSAQPCQLHPLLLPLVRRASSASHVTIERWDGSERAPPRIKPSLGIPGALSASAPPFPLYSRSFSSFW